MIEEVSKYQDLQIITDKIKQKGFYDKILQILLQMFKEESIFTFTELEKILTKQGEEDDILEQFWINSEVFRSNFILILTSMGINNVYLVNSIWRSEELVRQVLEENLVQGETKKNPQSTKQQFYGRKDHVNLSETEQKTRYGANQISNSKAAPASATKPLRNFEVIQQNEYSSKPPQKQPNYQSSTEHGRKNLSSANIKYGRSEFEVNPSSSSAKIDKSNLFKDFTRGSYKNVQETQLRPEESEQRRNSRSADRSSGKVRPGSAVKDRSREYGTGSQYSSVYSKILNASETNKVRKLIGEHNSDLDVVYLVTPE